MSGNKILAVNEIFGPTFQGEGKNIGAPCLFLRLAGCPLECIWCDTPYSWDWKRYSSRDEIHPMSVGDVVGRLLGLDKTNTRHLVITGGEPMLQSRMLPELRLELPDWYIEIETSGSVFPITNNWPALNWADLFTVSIKLQNSGNAVKKRINEKAINAFVASGRAIFKFVVTGMDDLEEINLLREKYNLGPVYIMPEGKNKETIDSRLLEMASIAIQYGYHLTTRLQVLAYGNKRAV